MKKIILLFVILYNSLSVSVLSHPVQLLKLLDELNVEGDQRVGVFENSASMKRRSRNRHAIIERNRREMERVCRSSKMADLRGDAEASRLDRIQRDEGKETGDEASIKMESDPETSTTGDGSSDESSDSRSLGESSVSSKSSSSSLASTLSSISTLGKKAAKKIGKVGKSMQRKLSKSLGNVSSAGRGSYTVQDDSDAITPDPDSSDGEDKVDKKMKRKKLKIKMKKAGNKMLQKLSDSISSLRYKDVEEEEKALKEKIKEEKKKKKKKGLFGKLGKSLTSLNPFSSSSSSKLDQEAKGQGEEKKKVKRGKKRGVKSLSSAAELSQSAPEIGQGDIDEADKVGGKKKKKGLFGRLSKSTGDMSESKGASMGDLELKKGKGKGLGRLKRIFKRKKGKGGSSDPVSVPMSTRGRSDERFGESSEDTSSTSSSGSDVDIESLYAKVDFSKKRRRQEGGPKNQILVHADVHRESGGFGEDSDSEGPPLLPMAPQLPEEPVQEPSPLPIQIPDLVSNTQTSDATSTQGDNRREIDSGSDSDSDGEISWKDSLPRKSGGRRRRRHNSYPLKHYSSKIHRDESNSNRFKVTPKGDGKSGDEAKPSQKPPLKPKPLFTKGLGGYPFDKKVSSSTPPPPPTSPPPEDDDDSSPSSPETKVMDSSVSAPPPPPPPTSPPPEDDDSSPSSPETKVVDSSVSAPPPPPPTSPPPEDDDSSPSSPETKVMDSSVSAPPPPPPTSPPPEDDDSSPSSPETKVMDSSVSAPPPPPPTSPPPEDDDSSPSLPETKVADPSLPSAAAAAAPPPPPPPPLPSPSPSLKSPLMVLSGKKQKSNSMPDLPTSSPFTLTPEELQAKFSSLKKVGEKGIRGNRQYSMSFPGASKGGNPQSELMKSLMAKLDERRKKMDDKDDNGESDDEWN